MDYSTEGRVVWGNTDRLPKTNDYDNEYFIGAAPIFVYRKETNMSRDSRHEETTYKRQGEVSVSKINRKYVRKAGESIERDDIYLKEDDSVNFHIYADIRT